MLEKELSVSSSFRAYHFNACSFKDQLIYQIALSRLPPKLQRRFRHYAVLSTNLYHGLLERAGKLWLVTQSQ